MNDVEQITRIREELIKRYGGIEAYFKHCQAQERAWAARSRQRRKKPTRRARKNTKRKPGQ